MRTFKPNLQKLETRQLMAGDVDFGHLADRFETRMTSLDSSVNAVQSATKLPVVGNMFKGQDDLVDLDGGVSQEIADALRTLPDGASASQVRQVLADRLMQIGYLGDHNGDRVINQNDVVVTLNHAAQDIDITTRLTKSVHADAARALDFDLGLEQVPLKLTSNGDLSLQVGIDYQNFKFGLDNGVFELDTSNKDELKIQLFAGLRNNTLEGRIGFVEFSANQQDDPGASPTQLDATITMDVTKSGVEWEIDGVADVHLDLYAGIAGMSQTAPSIGADFDFSWNFSNLRAVAGLKGVSAAPSLSLNNVRLKLGQVLSDVVRPWLTEVQKVTSPLQPIVDVLNAPIPGLSDLSNLVGNGDITLIDLANGWGDYTTGDGVMWPHRQAAMQRESVAMLRTAITITEVIDVINSLSADAKNLEIQLGSYQITGNGSDDIRHAVVAKAESATQAIGSKLGIKKLEEFDVIETLNKVVGSDKAAAKELKDSAVRIDGDLNLQMPMFTGTPWVMMLLGQESDLIRLDADAQIDIDSKIPFVNFFGLGVGLDAKLDFDAQLGIGFDTRGFLDNDLLQGFYIDTHSFAEFSGSATLYAGFDVGVASATVNGGISTAGGKVRLEFGDDVIDGKLRPNEIANLSLGQLFVTSGQIDVQASLRAEIGVDTPFGFLGASKEYVFAKHTILDLNRDVSNGNPWQPPADPNLAFLDSQGTLVLNVGTLANGPKPRTVGVGEIDEIYRIEQIGGTAGNAMIRVHAFGATEDFQGVQRIYGNAGDGDDRITIDRSVLTDVELLGGDGADRLLAHGSGMTRLQGDDGKDHLIVSQAEAVISGGDGDDYIKLGSGQYSFAYGGHGSDTIHGGRGAADLFGNGDDDLIFAGEGDVRVFGGNGDDVIELSSGESVVFAGTGANRVIWDVTDGNAMVDAVGQTTVEVMGTKTRDEINVNGWGPTQPHQHVGGAQIESVGTQRQLEIGLMTSGFETEEELATANGSGVRMQLRIEGGLETDTINVGAMSGSGIQSIAMNLSQMTQPDGAKDVITLEGTAQSDRVVVDQQEYFASVPKESKNPEGGLTGPTIKGGIMSVMGLQDYVAYVGNDGDQLDILLDSGDDIVEVRGTTGQTNFSGAHGDDQLMVSVDSASDLLGPIDFRAGSGRNHVDVRMERLQETVRAEVGGSSIVGAMTEIDSLGLETNYDFEIMFSNTGGKLRGLNYWTGSGDDEITLVDNTSNAPLLVDAGAGDDNLIVASRNFGSANTQGFQVFGGSGDNTLQAAHRTNNWHITGRRDVHLNGTPFHQIDHLSGSNRDDEFRFSDKTSFDGIIDGGDGRNSLDYSAWTDDVTVNLMLGSASNVNGGATDSVFNIQDFVGGSGDDVFIGDDADNQAYGGAGRDVLIGNAGADRLDGGADEDLMTGEHYVYSEDPSQINQLAKAWSRSGKADDVKHLVDQVFAPDDGEFDPLVNDILDYLF